MNRRAFLLSTSALSLISLAPDGAFATSCMALPPPTTQKIPLKIRQLGRERIDDYAWLKDPNWKAVWQNPQVLRKEILEHLKTENAYASAVMAGEKQLEADLYVEMASRTDTDDTPPGHRNGDWIYFTRFSAGANNLSYLRRPSGGDGSEELLLDGQERSRGHAYFKIVGATNSPDQALFAWGEDVFGSERFRIHIKDLKSRTILANTIDGAFGPFVFSSDSQWIFWIWRDENSRPAKVFRRPVRGGDDILVYEQSDLANLMTVTRTASGSHVMIRTWNADDSEVWLVPADNPTAPAAVVQPRQTGLVYSVEEWRGRFVILTNADDAVDFKLMWADPQKSGREHWRDWIIHRPGHFVIDMLPFAGHFVWIERVDANPVVVSVRAGDLAQSVIPFDEAAYAVSFDDDQEFERDSVRLVYQSPRQPKSWIEYELSAGSRKTLKVQGAGPSFSPDNYVVERVWARADDGARVPITLLRRKSDPPNGKRPLLLYGYGSYGWPTDAEFSISNLSLVDRGWAYAIAHVRGGSEMGWAWYLQARQFQKKKTFTDFISCAQHLGDAGYAARNKIVIHGFSAGGLLVGAVTNLRPDLWAGVIAQAPFVDMLNTMSDASHPLVPLTYPDWGNPLVDPAAYDYIASYSPYENVSAKAYPPVLATTSVADDRVGYWEPAKWIAKLRAKSTSGNPMMMHVDVEAGHGGAAGRLAELKRDAMFYAFAIAAASGQGFC